MNLRQTVEYLYWEGLTASEILERIHRQFPDRNVDLFTINEMLEDMDQKNADYETWQ